MDIRRRRGKLQAAHGLRNFERDGIVHGSVGRIEICDASKLERVAGRHPGSNGQGTWPSTKKMGS